MKAVTRNLFREIKRTKNRFFSIFTICAIGVGFFSGVRATGNDMKISADNFYDEHQLFDLRIMSSFGLTEEDISALKEVDGVSEAIGSKYVDLTLNYDGQDNNTRVYSIAENSGINSLDITEGRMPQSENECILNSSTLKESIQVGSTITLNDPTEAEEFPLKHREYTVVGKFNTPMYISVTQRGSTTIGDGALDAFIYITESNFTQDVFTEAYIRSDELAELSRYSEEYELLRDNISDKLEQLGVSRSELRYDEVIGEAIQEISDGEKELEDSRSEGLQKLEEAKEELASAAIQISDGEKELEQAAVEIADGEKQISEAKQTLADAKTEIDKGKAELAENQQKLDDAEKTLSESHVQLSEAGMQLEEAQKQLDASKQQIEDAQEEIDTKRSELEAGKVMLEAGKEQLAAGVEKYESGLEEYNTYLEQYNTGLEEYEQGMAQLAQAEQLFGQDNAEVVQKREMLEQAKTQLDSLKVQLDDGKQQLESGKEQLDMYTALIEENEKTITDGEIQLNDAQAELDSGKQKYIDGLTQYLESYEQYQEGVKQYNEGYKEYSDGVVQLNDGRNKLADAERQYNDGMAELSANEQTFLDGKAEYEQGILDLAEAKQQYSDGLKEYEDAKAEFEQKIADAEQKLADGKKELEDAGNAEWYIFDRDDNPGYSEYSSNSERIDKIASIFPVFFLLVAALVCLTTMSRMVEEQRMQIGTLKSLGYSDFIIMRQYMSYAVIAAASGSLIGAFIGMFLFPFIIMFAYGMMYIINSYYFELNPANILTSAGSMVAAIALTVFFSVRSALSGTPAELMRPKAPKAGKRVFLERIGFIWNRLSFFGKVSGRNLFRYKRRMFMTVIGIAGCTALSLTGFGLKDSIGDVVDLQYNTLNQYSGYIAYDIKTDPQEIYDQLLGYNPDTDYTRALIKQYTLSSDSGNVQCYVTAFEDTGVFENMIVLRDRKSGEALSFETAEGGIIATEKLAKLLGVRQGEQVLLKISDSESVPVTIGAITEHYAGNYLYIPKEKYEELFGHNPEFNIIYFRNGISSDEAEQDIFKEKMFEADGILSISMNAGASKTFEDMMKIMDLVVVVLIVSAGALAFVVLYNLTNVNITERIREIATLKVLGFYDGEVSSYVFRENNILSVMGAFVGLGAGTALTQFIVETAEVDEVMFGRTIHLPSFLWAFLITIVFSLTVNFIMRRDLKKISMVESLKSVE